MRPFFAWLMILVGGLWVALTGACTLFYGYMGLVGVVSRDPNSHAYGWMFLIPAIVIGVVSIAPGAAILTAGILLARARPRLAAPQETPPEAPPNAPP